MPAEQADLPGAPTSLRRVKGYVVTDGVSILFFCEKQFVGSVAYKDFAAITTPNRIAPPKDCVTDPFTCFIDPSDD